jgi:NAD(P)-dependent dehydrogenase (short-subunit alcohol dehydrogenase family)
MQVDLKGQVAIVTGAAGGIGAAYAKALAASGARVVIADMDGDGAARSAQAISASFPDAAVPFAVDIARAEQTEALATFTESLFGRIDILVNNAAFMKPVVQEYGTSLLDYPLDLWRKTIDVNMTGTLNCIRAVAPKMIARGAGRIVNQSSIGAYEGGHAYGASKLGVQSLTVWFAQELGPRGITVNCIAPGMIKTAAGDDSRPQGMVEALAPMIPLKPLGDPEDLVGTLLYFVSDASKWVTGQTIRVDGGFIKRVA